MGVEEFFCEEGSPVGSRWEAKVFSELCVGVGEKAQNLGWDGRPDFGDNFFIILYGICVT